MADLATIFHWMKTRTWFYNSCGYMLTAGVSQPTRREQQKGRSDRWDLPLRGELVDRESWEYKEVSRCLAP